jgi:hypothetical protein
MVKIILGNISSRIIGYLPSEVGDELDKVLSYKVAQARYIPQVKRKQWDGVIHLYQKSKGQSFYSGLLSLAVQVLEKHGIGYEKVDSRVRPEVNLPHLKFTPPPNYEERDYQQFTIERAISRTRGILKVATGGGKTRTVSEMISRIKTSPFMFYVLTTDLMEQAYEDLSLVLNEPIGRIGGGYFDIKKINIPLGVAVATNMTLTPKLYLDDESKTVTQKVVNSTNFPNSDRIITLYPQGAQGYNNFYLELKWTGTVNMPVLLPITVELEVKTD